MKNYRIPQTDIIPCVAYYSLCDATTDPIKDAQKDGDGNASPMRKLGGLYI